MNANLGVSAEAEAAAEEMYRDEAKNLGFLRQHLPIRALKAYGMEVCILKTQASVKESMDKLEVVDSVRHAKLVPKFQAVINQLSKPAWSAEVAAVGAEGWAPGAGNPPANGYNQAGPQLSHGAAHTAAAAAAARPGQQQGLAYSLSTPFLLSHVDPNPAFTTPAAAPLGSNLGYATAPTAPLRQRQNPAAATTAAAATGGGGGGLHGQGGLGATVHAQPLATPSYPQFQNAAGTVYSDHLAELHGPVPNLGPNVGIMLPAGGPASVLGSSGALFPAPQQHFEDDPSLLVELHDVEGTQSVLATLDARYRMGVANQALEMLGAAFNPSTFQGDGHHGLLQPGMTQQGTVHPGQNPYSHYNTSAQQHQQQQHGGFGPSSSDFYTGCNEMPFPRGCDSPGCILLQMQVKLPGHAAVAAATAGGLAAAAKQLAAVWQKKHGGTVPSFTLTCGLNTVGWKAGFVRAVLKQGGEQQDHQQRGGIGFREAVLVGPGELFSLPQLRLEKGDKVFAGIPGIRLMHIGPQKEGAGYVRVNKRSSGCSSAGGFEECSSSAGSEDSAADAADGGWYGPLKPGCWQLCIERGWVLSTTDTLMVVIGGNSSSSSSCGMNQDTQDALVSW